MRQPRAISTILLGLSLVVSSCDSNDLDDAPAGIQPTITVRYVNVHQDEPAKTNAIVTVILDVQSESGVDYSPAPVQVDDAVESEARFSLTLPPDSVYSFRATLSSEGESIAEGSVVQFIAEGASAVEIPVIAFDGAPWLGVLPSVVNTPTSSGSMELLMRYYGDGNGIEGIAAEMTVSGPAPVPVEFTGMALLEVEGDKASLGWQFAQPVSGNRDLGAISVPRNESSEFCLDLNPGSVKTVDGAGQIAVIGASGACIDVD